MAVEDQSHARLAKQIDLDGNHGHWQTRTTCSHRNRDPFRERLEKTDVSHFGSLAAMRTARRARASASVGTTPRSMMDRRPEPMPDRRATSFMDRPGMVRRHARHVVPLVVVFMAVPYSGA